MVSWRLLTSIRLAGPGNRMAPRLLEARSSVDGQILGQVALGLRGGLVLVLDRAPELLPVDGNGARRGDADADAGARDFDHLDDDIVAEHDLLARAPRDDEHGNGSSLEPWGTGAIRGVYPSQALSRNLGCLLREQRGAHRGVRGLVDDLVATAAGDEDRGAQVGAEILQRLGRADGHVDRGVVGPAHADALSLVVGE